MPHITAPESAEHESITVPKEASQLFGAYLRQEFKESLEAIGKPQNQRLINFIDNLETSKEIKLVTKGRILDFEFSKEKDEAEPIADSFTLDKHLISPFLDAVDHNVRNSLFELVTFNNKIPFKMADALTPLLEAAELEISRDKNGKIKIIPLARRTTI